MVWDCSSIGKCGSKLCCQTVLRVAPEQIRLATEEEKTLRALPQAELLGIKDLIDGGALKSQQFIDLASQDYPMSSQDGRAMDVDPSNLDPTLQTVSRDNPSEVSEHVLPSEATSSISPDKTSVSTPVEPQEPEQQPPPLSSAPLPSGESSLTGSTPEPASESTVTSETYGPVRRKVLGKSDAAAIWRPPALRQEDFVSIMREVVPRLIEELPRDEPMSTSQKRTLEAESSELEPASSRPRVETPVSEILSAELMNGPIDIDVLIADYLQKKMEKELPHSNNDPPRQRMIDSGKAAEWKTLSEKPNVLKIHYGQAAKKIRAESSHRFIGSRFVITRKAIE